jgi:hypothetical protein
VPTDQNTLNWIWVLTAILLPIIPAFILYKFLPASADVSGPFYGLEIKLGGSVAIYFLLVLIIYFGPRPKAAYEVWTVKGKIQDRDGGSLSQDKINLNIQPRTVDYIQDEGTFEMDILVKRGQSGQSKFPKLLVEWQPAQAFGNATVHLDPSDQVFAAKKYNMNVNDKWREITITDPIVLEQKIPEKPYAPAQPAPKPTVLPATATPVNTASPIPNNTP